MPINDRIQSTLTDCRRIQLIGNERIQFPLKKLQENGVPPASLVTELKRFQPYCPTNIPGIIDILISDIATFDPTTGYFILNDNTTIASNQRLIIPVGIILGVSGTILTNNGIIIVEGSLIVYNSGLLNNNSLLNISLGRAITARDSRPANDSGTVTARDFGFINNSGDINAFGDIVITSGAILTNTGILNINAGGELIIDSNDINPTYVNNAGGNINNNGTISNDMQGQIYNNSNGLFDNRNGIYNSGSPPNTGIFFNADGTSFCGIGIITNGSVPIPIDGGTCPIKEILLVNIANEVTAAFWVLNADTTIEFDERLIIPSGTPSITLQVSGTTLTNNGVIIVEGTLISTADFVSGAAGTIINTNQIDISAEGEINLTDNGYLSNSGAINNFGSIRIQTIAILTNTSVINNNSDAVITIFNGSDPTYINNDGGQINNNGTILNNYNGQIYNNSEGTVDNTNGIYTFGDPPTNGTFYNADGTGACGTGYIINNSEPIPIEGTDCGPATNEIFIQDIATEDPAGSGFYYLNESYTLEDSKILIISSTDTLNVYGKELTNNGTITVQGTLKASIAQSGTDEGIITNVGTINISSGGLIFVTNNGNLNNVGTINNNSTIQIQSIAILTNAGTINNTADSSLEIKHGDDPTYMINTGLINNNGLLANTGQIYNNSNGTVDNTNGSYIYIDPPNNGTFFNADGTDACGIGFINNNSEPIPIEGNDCPPENNNISLAEIATEETPNNWILNADYTIANGKILTISSTDTLDVLGRVLTNDGTIIIVGILRSSVNPKSGVEGTITNNSQIDISVGGTFVATNKGNINNSGTINNNATITIESIAILENTGTINNNSDAVITIFNGTDPTYINNIGGSIINDGTINNDNLGQIFNNTGGTVDNTNGTYNSGTGKFYNADGTGACGVGIIINNSEPIPIYGTDCEPGANEIVITDIATLDTDTGFYNLNTDTTIPFNGILTISSGIVLIALGNTLTNDGVINVEAGQLRASANLFTTGSITNNGNINITNGGNMILGESGTIFAGLNNVGNINISAESTLIIQAISSISNSGTIVNDLSGEIIINADSSQAVISNNGGTIINVGLTTNDNTGIIYNYNGGTFDISFGTYNPGSPPTNGLFYNADGTGTCGIGTIIGTLQADGSDCPP